MKNRFSQDERVTVFNGRVSRPRQIVVEALEAQAAEGATVEELCTLIGAEIGGVRPQGSIGQVLSYMATDDIVIEIRGRWYLKEHAPIAVDPAPSDKKPANGFFAKIAGVMQKRSEKTVSLYRMPTVYDDAIGVTLLINQRWTPVPLFGNLRICIDKEIPNWSPERIWYSDVEVVRITRRNGIVSEERPAPKDYVTIDQEE